SLIGVSPRRYFANLVPALFSTAVMVVAILVVQQLPIGPVAQLLPSVLLGAAVYSVTLFLVAPALVRELWSKVNLMLSRQAAS
ncbi:MAG: hypothetical protein WCB63_12290, partial [Polyangiales bacterium]